MKIIWKPVFAALLLPLSAVTLHADPGEGIKMGNLILHPFLDGSFSYDSNAGLLERTQYQDSEIEDDTEYEDDTFMEFRVGVNGDYKKERLNFNGSIWYYDRRYSDFQDYDRDGIGERVALIAGDRETLEVEAHQSFEHITDYSRQPALLNVFNPNAQQLYLTEDRTDRLEREVDAFGIRASRDFGEWLEAELGYSVYAVDYKPEELFDSEDKTIEGQLGFNATDKSTVLLRGRVGTESNDSYDNDADYNIIQLGLVSRRSEKLTYNMGIGFETYETPSADSDETSDEESVSFDVSAIWRMNYKTAVQLAGQNYIQSSSFSEQNTRKTTLAQISLLRRLSEALSLGLAVSFRQDDYRLPIETRFGLIEETRDTIAGSLTLNYAPQDEWYRLYGQASIEDSDSLIPREDYEQIRLSAGFSLYY